jgi:hypothetical protein
MLTRTKGSAAVKSNSTRTKAVIFLAIASTACATAGTAAVPATRNAVWAEHDLTIELQHLPKLYSCEDLTNKIHDILQTVGARVNMQILVSSCENGIDTRVVAPRAHLVFSLPFEVRGQLAGSGDLSARERTVRIEPGNPPSIDYSDCELLRQLEMTVFRAVPLPIDATRLTCQRITTQHTPFSFSVEALMPDASEPAKVSRIQSDNLTFAAKQV